MLLKNSQIQDRLFKKSLDFSGLFLPLVILGILLTLIIHSLPSLKEFGLPFVWHKTWNPVFDKFGALPFIVGTLLTSVLALLISVPFALAVSIFLGEYFKEGFLPSFVQTLVELLSGIPSVIYGFWGLFSLVPVIRALEMKINVPPFGVGIFTASLVLAIMIIPYAASLGREALRMVPQEMKDAAYSLGATRYEVIKTVVLPYAKSGIISGFFLALGRALGETMAVTMVIGNSQYLPKSIFSTSNTMASLIANEFTEAMGNLHLSSLVEIGLLLFLITTLINILGRWLIGINNKDQG